MIQSCAVLRKVSSPGEVAVRGPWPPVSETELGLGRAGCQATGKDPAERLSGQTLDPATADRVDRNTESKPSGKFGTTGNRRESLRMALIETAKNGAECGILESSRLALVSHGGRITSLAKALR